MTREQAIEEAGRAYAEVLAEMRKDGRRPVAESEPRQDDSERKAAAA